MCLAVPGKVIGIEENSERNGNSSLWRTGKVSFGGIIKEVSLAYVPDVKIGDYVIVHVGFALSIVDQEEAEETLTYLNQLQVEQSAVNMVQLITS
ncbi:MULTISPECIES: HypC/HybG/HupF family hydrogenase formation chaperone [unclassified Microcoleus]|uniref:HypC/HybG/HupF family hydrogenase formation chaperone n=1 Tax=unclassified Microcoleus TaxID=2642155 RepID=UPI002FCEF1CB